MGTGVSLAGFGDVLALLEGELEIFRYPAAELSERFGESYRRDAVAVLNALERFARTQGESLPAALGRYARLLPELVEERREFASADRRYGRQESGGEEGFEPRTYLYALTASTVLTRSRYEVYRDYRAVLPERAAGGPLLEIGAGNCLDAHFAARFGPVTAYELNPLSAVWREVVGGDGRLRLVIGSYDFSEAGAYRFVTMIELLEHLAVPQEALHGAHRVLADEGYAYLTFAVRMPQADHLYLFSSVDECRALLADTGFLPVHERCVLDTYRPYEEAESWRLAAETRLPLTYCCLACKRTAGTAALVADFNAGLEE